MDSLMERFGNPQEDIIWGMRQTIEARRKTKAERGFRRSNLSDNKLKLLKNTKTQVLASMVPDEVIMNTTDYAPKDFFACLLLGDLHGFTDLLEAVSLPGKGGAARFLEIMDEYIGEIVKVILSFNGDVLKFSGHSFLAMWKSKRKLELGYDVHSALNCSLEILKNFGKVATREGVDLQLKICITAGPLVFSLIGGLHSSHYICLGQPIDEFKEAKQRASWGEIIVSPIAWSEINNLDYLVIETEDKTHFKVLGVGPNWKAWGKGKSKKGGYVELARSDSESDSDSTTQYETDANKNVNLRNVALAGPSTLQEELSKFVISPILRALDVNEPLERLAEMRRLVIMHVNVVARKKTPTETVKIVHRCYRIVAKMAKQHKGVLIKTSLFDKDLIFVIVFGLRGLTNVLECQQALECSMKCRHRLTMMKEIQSVSVACSTGESFCGVCGQVLRRAYMVVSVYALKASRMASAYPDKVTCDRQTFLYSHLDADHFFSLEFKRLKGMAQPGPIYEYVDVKDALSGKVRPRDRFNYPILGRDTELERFRDMFDVYVKNFGIKPCCVFPQCSYKNCMMIEGYNKQGKTRLLEECVSGIKNVDIVRVPSRKDYRMIPYEGMRHLFGNNLRVENEHLMDRNKKDIKAKMLANCRTEDFDVLKHVLQIGSGSSQKLKNLTDEERKRIVENCVKSLCEVVIQKPCLVCIDNAEFIDVETWEILPKMLESKRLFLLATIRRRRVYSRSISMTLNKDCVERVVLKKIPEECLSALACQFLNSYAIPADLENIIQLSSNGHPGWVENFLTTLLQANKIYVQTTDYQNIHENKLVVPPLYYLKKMTSESKERYESFVQETTQKESVPDRWGFYLNGCRDDSANDYMWKSILKTYGLKNEMYACFLSKAFSPEYDVDPYIFDEMNMLEWIEGMSYEEQMMMKCCAILGDPFTRKILYYLYGMGNQRDVAEIIQGLFNKRILCCARGDFSGGGDYVLMRERGVDPTADTRIVCYCVGLDIDESCLLLPKFSCCGFMRFRSSKFRTAVYSIISESEKIELHGKAAKYIQKETRRCVACGCSYFTSPALRLDIKLSTSREKQKTHRKKRRAYDTDFDQLLMNYSRNTSDRSAIGRLQATSNKKVSIGYDWKKSSAGSKSSQPSFSSTKEDVKDIEETQLRFMGPLKIYKLQKSPSLVRTFSESDFLACECHLILGYMFQKLKCHYKGSGQWYQMIITSVHHIKICMANKNYAFAMKTIKDAMKFLTETEDNLEGPKWRNQMMIGKFHLLEATVLMDLEQMDNAREKLLMALKYFGYSFPENKTSVLFFLKLLKQRWAQKLGLYFFPRSFVRQEDNQVNLYIINTISETLYHLCRIYMMQGQWHLAELAAVWSLRTSLQAETSLIRISEAFVNMIQIAQHKKNKLMCLSLEVLSLRYCHKKKSFMEAPELGAVAQLYATIFEARISRCEYDRGLHLGYIVLHISTTAKQTQTTIQVLTLLSPILLEKMYLHDATSTLRELEYHADELDNNSGKTWYYALATSFHLETGYVYVPMGIIETFCYGEGFSKHTKYYEAKIRLVVTMWVWYLRNNRWESASTLNKDVNEYRNYKITSNNHAITTTYLLEGTLLTLVSQINRRNISGISKTKKEIKRLIRKLNGCSCTFIRGRLLHLQAYYAYILSKDDKINNLLKKARKFCVKNDFQMELLHLEHSEKAWNNHLSVAVREFWRNHCTTDNFIFYHELNYDNLKFYCYTYPMPRFDT